jgi:hypothetical protein
MRRILLILLPAFVFFSCENSIPKNNLPIDQPFQIKYKEKLSNSDHQISLLFDSVRSDSRCPMNANCITAGNAEVKFIFEASKIDVKVMLNTNTDPKFLMTTQYKIELISLSPIPFIDRATVPSDYSAQVKITKN